MELSAHDQLVLECLETFEEGFGSPDGCNVDLLAAEGLVAREPAGWVLTNAGKVRLKNLKSVARSASGLTM